MIPPVNAAVPPTRSPGLSDQVLRKTAQELETNFLAEMLKSAGLGKPRDGFGGGAGEEQFASFLRLEQARAMVQSGGLGLTEAFFNALKEKTDDI